MCTVCLNNGIYALTNSQQKRSGFHTGPDSYKLRFGARYEEHFHNCYTYALTFINCVLSAQGKKQMNKSEFTERFVIPRTRKASKYITIYKEICNSGFYVIDDPDQEEGTSTGYNEANTNRNGSNIL
ncbi:hypothetical protein lerEdw1_015741 [Lerista edwardsae]|nr:hypothetical protein lerEdw1_015741 [Lerista edwardsae]